MPDPIVFDELGKAASSAVLPSTSGHAIIAFFQKLKDARLHPEDTSRSPRRF
jgi:hypothetical protein